MDPLLRLLSSDVPRGLAVEQRPEWALGQERVGGFQSVASPEVAARRFAAPTPAEARRNVRATVQDTALEPSKAYAVELLNRIAKSMIGDPKHPLPQDMTEKERRDFVMETGLGFLSPGILAGVGSKTAPLAALKAAIKAEQEGKPSQEIWRQHGWARGAEGKWRYEIPDQGLQVYNPSATMMRGAVAHPELYAAYPELGSRPLRLKIQAELQASGSYNPATARTSVEAPNVEGARSVLSHELQHNVQDIEGFAPGTSLGQGAEKYERSAGEQEARNVQARLADPDLRRMAPELTESLPREQQIIAQDPKAIAEALRGKELPVITTREEYLEHRRRYGLPNASPAPGKLPFGKNPVTFIDDATGKPVARTLVDPSDLPSGVILRRR